MIAFKTCGKLDWAGEYAILEPGQLAVIKAIPIYMRGEIAFIKANCPGSKIAYSPAQ